MKRCDTCGDEYDRYAPCDCREIAEKLNVYGPRFEEWLVKVINHQINKRAQEREDAQKWAPPYTLEPRDA